MKSPINVPSPGTIASYRKGQYHAHEQPAQWHVHLDNYDPKVHPYLHLVDDAPLLLIIGDTVVTLIAGSRKKTGNEKEILNDAHGYCWCHRLFTGAYAAGEWDPDTCFPIDRIPGCKIRINNIL